MNNMFYIKSLLAVVVALLVAAALGHAEASSPAAGTRLEQNAPGSAVSKPGGGAAQRGSEPNAGEVRPGNHEGNAPSASAGTLLRGPVERRIFGLPVRAAIVSGGVILALALVGFAIQHGRRAGGAQATPTAAATLGVDPGSKSALSRPSSHESDGAPQ
jgi:hypothetical protein